MRGRWTSVATLLALAAPRVADAQTIEPTRVHRVRVASAAEARGPRGDGTRNGRALGGLPDAPTVRFRTALPGPLSVPPAVGADGRIAVVVGGAMAVHVLSAEGVDLGAIPLGARATSTSPAFLADGTLVVLTIDGAVVFVDPDGAVQRRVAVGPRGANALPPTPTPAGGVVIVAGRQLIELDAEGRVLAQAEVAEPLASPIAVARSPAGGHEILFADATGELRALRAPFSPQRLTSLGGPAPGGVAVADDGAAWVVVSGALLRVERRVGADPWRANATAGVPASMPSPALGPDGAAAFVGVDGSLVVLEPTGEVRYRVALESASPAIATPGVFRVFDDAPPLLLDPAGRVAFARPTGRVGVVSPEGRVAIASERACATPIGIASGLPNRFVVGCAEGAVVGIGVADEDASPPD